MRQLHTFRSVVRWFVAVVAATVIAAIPRRLRSHDLAVGTPLTWHTRQEVITLGEQPHGFSLWLLLVDIALVLVGLVMLRMAISKLVPR